PGAQPHGPAQLVNPAQLAQFVDDAVRGVGIELRAVCSFETADVARVFDHRALKAQANAEVGHFARAGKFAGLEHALDSPLAKSSRHQNGVEPFELLLPVVSREPFGFDPDDVGLNVIGKSAVSERLVQALVGVLQLDILTHDGDRDLAAGMAQTLHQVNPGLHIPLGGLEPEATQDLGVKTFARQHQRNFVNVLDVFRGDHSLFRNAAEQRDLGLEVRSKVAVRAAKQDVRLDADLPQLSDRVLGGLGLEFP